MTEHILKTFATVKAEGRAAFVAYLTAGFPNAESSVPLIKSLEAGGADIIEIGVPFTDPLADGTTIQKANQTALDAGVTSLTHVLNIVSIARKEGVKVPIVLMGYYNPFMQYGQEKVMQDCKEAGVNGFIIVDLPPEESIPFREACRKHRLSFIPLIAPTTTPARVAHLAKCGDSFIYAVSLTGVTGERTQISNEVPKIVAGIRQHTSLPIAVGFGIGNHEQFADVAKVADGVVIGSAIIRTVEKAGPAEAPAAVKAFCQEVTGRTTVTVVEADAVASTGDVVKLDEGDKGNADCFRFGDFGGRYVPETLVEALEELERTYNSLKDDPEFIKEFRSYYTYIGRPSAFHLAERLTALAGGAKIWLKREDLNHTGAHKINNAVGQALVAKRLGKKRIIAETGAGQHGVASATVCALLGLDLTVYMGAEDVKRQQLNVFRMEMMGAKVVPVDSGSRTLKDAINEAMRDWVTNIRTTHYLVGSAIGPHPFPTIVRDFQSVIGKETKEQALTHIGKLPDAVLACVGGGSNAIGMFHPFINDKSVRLVGVEAAGEGVETGHHSATLCAGTPGVLHGTRTYLLQDSKGQIQETHSISAGLDYPGVGPEHAFLKDIGRAEYVAVTDREALIGMKLMAQNEGIIPALETAHAVYHAVELAKTLPKEQNIVVCVSGRGDKDMESVRKVIHNYNI
eukprot:Colp12_sorted_trinity150504_noHs@22677